MTDLESPNVPYYRKRRVYLHQHRKVVHRMATRKFVWHINGVKTTSVVSYDNTGAAVGVVEDGRCYLYIKEEN